MYVTHLTLRIQNLMDELEILKDEVNSIAAESIQWSVGDFADEAARLEKRRAMPDIFDRSKFQNALESMIGKHDCETGISWETVRCYLDEYCLNKE